MRDHAEYVYTEIAEGEYQVIPVAYQPTDEYYTHTPTGKTFKIIRQRPMLWAHDISPGISQLSDHMARWLFSTRRDEFKPTQQGGLTV